MQMNSRPSSWWLPLALSAPLVFAGCDEEDMVGSVEGDAGSLQGGALLDSSSASTAEPIVAATGDADASSVASTETAGPGTTAADAGTTEPVVGETWPTVDASSAGTPAAATSDQGPGSGHTSNHSDPSKGTSRNKYVPEDSRLVTFDELASFWYEAPEPEEVVENPDFKPENQFPEFVREMDGQKVTLEGYVVPISIEKGRVKAFILSRYVANCCFGMMPELNEWVEVEMPDGKGLDFLPYGTVLTTGTMRVGEVFDEYGYIRSLYRVDAETVVEPDY